MHSIKLSIPSQGGTGREKGRIPLRDITAVEMADDEALGRRPNGFQV